MMARHRQTVKPSIGVKGQLGLGVSCRISYRIGDCKKLFKILGQGCVSDDVVVGPSSLN